MRFRHLDYPAGTPPEELGLAALDDLLNRGDLEAWAPAGALDALGCRLVHRRAAGRGRARLSTPPPPPGCRLASWCKARPTASV